MRLEDLLLKLDAALNFVLYDADNDRIGIFKYHDVGLDQWASRDIRNIDVIDNKLCIFLDCL